MQRHPDCLLDELLLACEEFPWQEVLLGVHRLSEEGKVQLTPISYGSCTVRLVEYQNPGTFRERSTALRGDNKLVPGH